MNDKEIFFLICRYLSEECSADEEQWLEDWLAGDQTHRKYFREIKKVWDVKPDSDVDINFGHEWKRISKRLGIKGEPNEYKAKKSSHWKNSNNLVKYLMRAAAVILLVGLTAVYFFNVGTHVSSDNSPAVKEAEMRKVQAGRGEKATIKFGDGSKVLLNSMSSVRFPRNFKGKRREIFLNGEAFFKVAHNKKRPFVVHAHGATIRDIGTQFNINAYKENSSVEVVVQNGKVAVRQDSLATQNKSGTKKSADSRRDEVFLRQGQKTLVEDGKRPTKPEAVSLTPYLAWTNDRMVFEGTPLRDVIQRLKRAYDLTFVVRDSTLLSERLEASFKRERPEKVLGIIAFSLGINYKLQGDTVILTSKANN